MQSRMPTERGASRFPWGTTSTVRIKPRVGCAGGCCASAVVVTPNPSTQRTGTARMPSTGGGWPHASAPSSARMRFAGAGCPQLRRDGLLRDRQLDPVDDLAVADLERRTRLDARGVARDPLALAEAEDRVDDPARHRQLQDVAGAGQALV